MTLIKKTPKAPKTNFAVMYGGKGEEEDLFNL